MEEIRLFAYLYCSKSNPFGKKLCFLKNFRKGVDNITLSLYIVIISKANSKGRQAGRDGKHEEND